MNNIVKTYMKNLNTLNRKDYMFEIMKYNLAPTLYKVKCSTLLNFYNREQYCFWKENKYEIINKFNLKSFELSYSEDSMTVLFYDENLMLKCLKSPDCIEFLYTYNYDEKFSVENYMELLKLRYKKEFPHEIGLFLGFPLWDVVDYIKNQGKNYIYCSYWKVYRNLNFALDIFEKYNSAKLKAIENTNLNRCHSKKIGVL